MFQIHFASSNRRIRIPLILLTALVPTILAASDSSSPGASTPIPQGIEKGRVAPTTLEGQWQIVDGEINGDEGVGRLKGRLWTFTEERLEVGTAGDPNNPDKVFSMKFDYKTEPDNDPRRLVMTLVDEAGQTVVNRAIYELDGNRLVVCWTFNALPNVKIPFPKAFASRKGDPNTMVLILKRIPAK